MKKNALLSLVVTFFVLSMFGQDTLILQPDNLKGKDAIIYSINPQTNYGNVVSLQTGTWTWSGQPGSFRSFIEFNLSEIPDSTTIVSAHLILSSAPNYNNGITDGEHSNYTASNASSLYRVTTPWDEEEINWSNAPEIDVQNPIHMVQSTSPDQSYKIDVTSFIIDMVNNITPNHGFMLRQTTERQYAAMVFASSDHEVVENRPKLEIVYENAIVTGVTSQENSIYTFQAYPNPTTSELYIDLKDNSAEGVIISIHDLQGKKYASITCNHQKNIRLPFDVPKGVYLLRITSKEQEVQLLKVIKR